MTSIIGINCKDGVVIGADSSATFGNGQFNTIEQPYEKIDVICDKIIVAGTGQIGLGQRFCAIVSKAWDEKIFTQPAIEVGKSLCKKAINDFIETNTPNNQYGALVAFPSEHKHHLIEFSLVGFQPELKTERLWYVSMCSAQLITDPFLAFIREIFWKDEPPTIHEAVFAVTWTLEHAIQINPGGVNGPIKIAVLERNEKGQHNARYYSEDDLGEHYQSIEEAKQHLRDYRAKLQSPDQDLQVPVP